MSETTVDQVADAIIAYCNKHGDLISNLRLQKLLYYAQAWHLALPELDRPLFDAPLEAWVHGPVHPATYGRFKEFGFKPIDYDPGMLAVSTGVLRHVENVMDAYGGFGASELERMTHAEEPWLEARGDLPPDESSSNRISTDTMKAYYRRRLDGQE